MAYINYLQYDITYIDSTVLDSKSRNIPEVVVVRRGAVGVLGIGKGGTVG